MTAPTAGFRRFAFALFDWGQHGYWVLVATFIFTPYFAAGFVGDPVRGQALLGFGGAIAGALSAILSVAMGAQIDARGRPRRWLLILSVPFVLACSGLWFAAPGEAGLIGPVMALMILANVAAEVTAAVANTLLPTLAAPGKVGRLSGSAAALGYFGGLAALILVLAAFALPAHPLLGLDKALHEPDRIVGPLAALWYLVFALPLLATAPDGPGRAGAGVALTDLWALVRALPSRPLMLRFLVGRMLVGDGVTAIVAFGGVLAAGLFGWKTTELGIYGILLAATAGIGAWAGGRLDDRLGSRRTVLVAVAMLLVGAAGLASVGAAMRTPGAGLFSGAGERAYLGFSLVIGLAYGPVQAAMRSWMARLAPPEEVGRWFGLYAMSGKATTFAAPLLIGLATAVTHQQKAAIPVIGLFLAAGAWVLMQVREDAPISARRP